MSVHTIARATAVNQVDKMGAKGGPVAPATGGIPAGAPGTVLSGSAAWTPGGIAAGGTATTTVTVTGARVGDKVQLNASPPFPGGVNVASRVTANDTVTLLAVNNEGSALDPGTVTALVSVIPAGQVGRNDGSS